METKLDLISAKCFSAALSGWMDAPLLMQLQLVQIHYQKHAGIEPLWHHSLLRFLALVSFKLMLMTRLGAAGVC